MKRSITYESYRMIHTVWYLLSSVHWATNCTNMYIPAKSYKPVMSRRFRQKINVNAYKKTSLCHHISFVIWKKKYGVRKWVGPVLGRGDTKLEWSYGEKEGWEVRDPNFGRYGTFCSIENMKFNAWSCMQHTECFIQKMTIAWLQC